MRADYLILKQGDDAARYRQVRRALRWVGRKTSTVFRNPEIRYLLNPYDALYGPDNLIRMGIGSYFNGPPHVHRYWTNDGHVVIGNYCSIAAGVEFMVGGEHHPEWVTTFPLHHDKNEVTSRGSIVIGNDVWIGRNVSILSGVTIGDGAVVGMGALITSDIPPYTIVGGVPARTIRRRFSDSQITRLLSVRWWDWPAERIAAHVHLLQSDDIEGFLNAAEALGNPPGPGTPPPA